MTVRKRPWPCWPSLAILFSILSQLGDRWTGNKALSVPGQDSNTCHCKPFCNWLGQVLCTVQVSASPHRVGKHVKGECSYLWWIHPFFHPLALLLATFKFHPLILKPCFHLEVMGKGHGALETHSQRLRHMLKIFCLLLNPVSAWFLILCMILAASSMQQVATESELGHENTLPTPQITMGSSITSKPLPKDRSRHLQKHSLLLQQHVTAEPRPMLTQE